MGTILTIGEPMVVFKAQETNVSLAEAANFQKFSAGAELNVALGLARLWHATEYVSAVGQDPFGAYLQAEMRRNHVGVTNLVTKAAYPTGFYLKQNVDHGDPAVYYFRRGSAAAHYDLNDLRGVDLTQVQLAHLSGIFAALSAESLAVYRQLNRELLQHNIPVTFDPNLRPTLWSSTAEMVRVTNQLAQTATVVLPGLGEGETLTGSRDPEAIADFYLHQSEVTQLVVVKLGAQGAFAQRATGEKLWVPGFHVAPVVDTVGAGDGFAVGLISALQEKLSLEQALRRACAIGAMAVQVMGDNDGYPTPEQLKTFYQEHPTQN
ncbi:sugar kinase [Levilactobacillus acidifarinae]|uniref:2-dehydro-3-deoxygluconokinase n=1 Tax=Levilactobacillus acidifarinae DSM 19394 = JCM 15949 TaxID=1423715 RepID=A0A0R1LIG1_9LACO|nr:sugar kinase [Levilactobacillus acidifarinae]KRK95724.1 2-dehydro-3-deoxygluconokinase [Levilactobacillus acidifarinae DSM 19394]GEO69460.1 2-dehydro-3-deoxygluconokinase [Levilactobacillus acidifarinae]